MDNTYHKWQHVHKTSDSQPACIRKIAEGLADLKESLPGGSISDNAQKQRFLDAIDSRLPFNVEPELRKEATWDQIIVVTEQA